MKKLTEKYIISTIDDETGKRMYWNNGDGVWYYGQSQGTTYENYDEANLDVPEADLNLPSDSMYPVEVLEGSKRWSKMKEDINGNEFVIQLPNKAYWGYGSATEIYDAEHYETREAAVKECRRIYDGSNPFYIVEVAEDDFGDMNRIVKKTKFNPMKENKLKEESTEVPEMKWFRGGSVYKPNLLSGEGVDAVAVDSYIDKLVKEHNNHFEIKDPRITEELYFEIQYWETGDGDNVYVDILFNREFDREMNAGKWGKKSYGATNEHGYVEDLLNNGGLEKLGIADARITGVGWDSSKHVPRWSIELFTFSDRNMDGTFKRPNVSDSWTSSHNVNGTEPFNKEEGKEINKEVTDYIIELLKANPARVYYKPSKDITKVDIVDSRTRSYDPSWKGSYTHNTGWFGFTCYIEDAYDENATDWRGRQGDTFRADEDAITSLLHDKAAEILNDFLYEFNLEVVPDGCKAEWYHGSEEDDKYGLWFDVSIKFKEIGIDPDKSYFAHQGNSFKDYWPGSEPEDLYKGKTFKRNPKRIKEGLFDNVESEAELSTPSMEKYKDVITSSIDEGIANRETPRETIENTIYEVQRFFPEDDIDGEALRKYVSKKVYERNPYEEEADEYLKESKNLKERVMTAEEADFHEGDVYKNRYGWTIVIEELDGDYVHIKQYLDTKRDQVTTHMKLIPSLYEHLMNYHFTKIRNLNDEKLTEKRIISDEFDLGWDKAELKSAFKDIGCKLKFWKYSAEPYFTIYYNDSPVGTLKPGRANEYYELSFTGDIDCSGMRPSESNMKWAGNGIEELKADCQDFYENAVAKIRK